MGNAVCIMWKKIKYNGCLTLIKNTLTLADLFFVVVVVVEEQALDKHKTVIFVPEN